MSDLERPVRYFRVRVQAWGYATVRGRTKKEAVENARAGDYVSTPRPAWEAMVSDVREVERS